MESVITASINLVSAITCMEQEKETFEDLVKAGKFQKASLELKEGVGQEELKSMAVILYANSKGLAPNAELHNLLLKMSVECIPIKLNFLDHSKSVRKGINDKNEFLYLLFAARLPISMTGKAKLELAIDAFIAHLLTIGEEKFSVDWIYSEADKDEIDVLKHVADRIFKNENMSFRLIFETLGISKIGDGFLKLNPSEQSDRIKLYFSTNQLLKIESWNNRVHPSLITKIEHKLTRGEFEEYLGINGTRGRT